MHGGHFMDVQGGTPTAPQGAMLAIPNKSLKQKIPEQTFEDFGADEGI